MGALLSAGVGVGDGGRHSIGFKNGPGENLTMLSRETIISLDLF